VKRYDFNPSELEPGQRLDVFLAGKFHGLYSRSFIKRLIDKGLVFVNGRPCRAHQRLRLNQTVEVVIPQDEDESGGILPQDIPLEIKFEDEHLLVVNKPAGMVVHPTESLTKDTLVNALLFHCQRLSWLGGPLRPGIVHRLDKDTSGLLVVAKDEPTHLALSEQFRQHQVKRRYVALVEGEVSADEGLIELPIGRHPRNRKKMSVAFRNAKRAKTIYRVLSRLKDVTLLELSPLTGRTHQLRVHLAYMGFPILGDSKYGSKKRVSRLALHAAGLGFFHPRSGQFLEFECEIPQDMKTLIEQANCGRL
jgi:23S rRNA pseudouridine1911/1915/1917 synthase